MFTGSKLMKVHTCSTILILNLLTASPGNRHQISQCIFSSQVLKCNAVKVFTKVGPLAKAGGTRLKPGKASFFEGPSKEHERAPSKTVDLEGKKNSVAKIGSKIKGL